MAYTYDASNLLVTTYSGRLNVVRLLIGDNVVADPQLQDEEINFSLSQTGDNVYFAGSYCARVLAGKYSREVDTQLDGALEAKYSDKVKQYNLLAIRLSEMGKKYSGKALGVVAGGISLADISTNDLDTDRPLPSFRMGQFKNGSD